MTDIVLVGGGHAHVQVLRRQIMDPAPARITLVVDRPTATYSGMVPAFVAGDLPRDALEIDLRPLARRAGARFVVGRCHRIDPHAREVHVEGRAPIRYHLCSLNTGSVVAGLDTPGVREHAVPTRPVGAFCSRVDAALAERGIADVVVVGAGAAGVELAFTLERRLSRSGGAPRVCLVEAGDRLLPGLSASAAARVARHAEARGLRVLTSAPVVRVERDAVTLADGRTLRSDLTVWVAGAAGPPLLAASGLPVDARGFVKVRDTLQVHGHDDLFAVGDCAVPDAWPQIPKAGVYAVREGPVLGRNLRAALTGGRLRRYRPQRRFLAMLNLGDGVAIGTRGRLSFEGRWVMGWKDRIDRRFVERFQALTPSGAPTGDLPAMPPMDAPCGGCAAKLAASPLSRALARLPARPDADVVLGVGEADDVAVVRHGDGVVALNVDAFPAFTDDPWLVGRVAAVNATSDLAAKGVAPRHALALVTVPDDDEETLFQVLAGARSALDDDGVALVGGHTTVGEELSVGFAVVGFARPDAVVRNVGLAPGDVLVLTRALGTGVLFHADMRGAARGAWMEAAVAGMMRGNVAAGRIAAGAARAVTDVTGFGLAGHLAEMLRPGDVSAVLSLRDVPALPGAVTLLARGERSTSHDRNAALRSGIAIARHTPAVELLFDPQTAGGLLIGVPPDRAQDLVDAIRSAGDADAAIIGRVTPPRPDGALFSVE